MTSPHVLKLPLGSLILLLGQEHLYPRHLRHLRVYRHPAEGLQLVVVPGRVRSLAGQILYKWRILYLIVLS